MSQFKTVLVAGASGAGGLGFKIANAFLDKRQFSVRILARQENDHTNKLKERGAEIVLIPEFTDVEALKKVNVGVLNLINSINRGQF
jgi:NAD(P)-dependent dehydrogenase (short-subunit alcohol dehydrogenase family)